MAPSSQKKKNSLPPKQNHSAAPHLAIHGLPSISSSEPYLHNLPHLSSSPQLHLPRRSRWLWIRRPPHCSSIRRPRCLRGRGAHGPHGPHANQKTKKPLPMASCLGATWSDGAGIVATGSGLARLWPAVR
jgi:hypothetical protein